MSMRVTMIGVKSWCDKFIDVWNVVKKMIGVKSWCNKVIDVSNVVENRWFSPVDMVSTRFLKRWTLCIHNFWIRSYIESLHYYYLPVAYNNVVCAILCFVQSKHLVHDSFSSINYAMLITNEYDFGVNLLSFLMNAWSSLAFHSSIMTSTATHLHPLYRTVSHFITHTLYHTHNTALYHTHTQYI